MFLVSKAGLEDSDYLYKNCPPFTIVKQVQWFHIEKIRRFGSLLSLSGIVGVGKVNDCSSVENTRRSDPSIVESQEAWPHE